MNILITGGSGLLGSRLAIELSKNHLVTLVSRKKLISINNIKNEFVKEYNQTQLAKQDIIIHAASPNNMECDNSEIYKNYIEDTEKLILSSSKNKIKKFIFTSSTRIYGNNGIGEISENNPIVINDNYSKMKGHIENLLIDSSDKLDSSIVRISNSYGFPVFNNTKCWHLLVMYICKEIVHKNTVRLNSNGLEYKDFVPMNYVIENIVDIVSGTNETKSNIINICSGNTIIVKDFANYLIKKAEQFLDKKINLLLNNNKETFNKYNITNNKLKIKFNESYSDIEINKLLKFCKKSFA